MSVKIILLLLLQIARIVVSDTTGVCSKQVQKIKYERVPVVTQRRELLGPKKCLDEILCPKYYRIRKAIEYVMSKVNYMTTVKECCKGYYRLSQNHDYDTINCKPMCTPPCINSYCDSPDVCKCLPGYVKDIFLNNTCVSSIVASNNNEIDFSSSTEIFNNAVENTGQLPSYTNYKINNDDFTIVYEQIQNTNSTLSTDEISVEIDFESTTESFNYEVINTEEFSSHTNDMAGFDNYTKMKEKIFSNTTLRTNEVTAEDTVNKRLVYWIGGIVTSLILVCMVIFMVWKRTSNGTSSGSYSIEDTPQSARDKVQSKHIKLSFMTQKGKGKYNQKNEQK